MDRRDIEDDLQDLEDIGNVTRIRNMPRPKKGGSKSHPRPTNWIMKAEQMSDIFAQERGEFNMTYQAARHEAVWLKESLEYFFEQQWFDDVLRMIKGGKEASVYLVSGSKSTGEDYLAAKVYRPRMFRNLKNDWLYREGRANVDENGNRIRNKGMLHAIQKRTEYGRELLHTSWLEHEYQTLLLLREAGADVPRVFASGNNAILMEYFGDALMGAPTLNDVDLDRAEARQIYERVMHNIELMLSHDRIHADLSAFNILYWDGDIVLIDFPQSIHPRENSSAYQIFERDVVRVSQYFNRYRIHTNGRSDPRRIASQLWEKYNNRFVPEIDPKMLGDDAQDDERDLWESLRNA